MQTIFTQHHINQLARLSLFLLLSLLASCSDVPQAKWDNPLDSAGTNWNPPSVNLLSLSDSIYPIDLTITIKAKSVISVGSVVAYEWSIDHGVTWTDSTRADSVQKKWMLGGVYTLYVRAESRDGVFSQPDSINIRINRPPQIKIQRIGRDTIFASDTTSILASIVDTDGNQIDTLNWDLNGDGIFETHAPTAIPQIVRAPPIISGGIITVRVWCQDRLGVKDTVLVPIRFLPDRAPKISMIGSVPFLASVGLTDTIKLFVPDTAFTDADGNRVDSLWWDLYGTGTFKTVTSLRDSAFFSSPFAGNWVVSVKGKDALGLWSAVSQKTVYVNRDWASLSISAPDTAVYGQRVTLQANFTPGTYGGSIANVAWSVNGGVLIAGAITGNLVLTLPSSTTLAYSITVQITDTKGNVSSVTKKICVLPGFVDARDQHAYRTVNIGTQTWIARNLDYLPSTGASWCADGSSTSTCSTTYGRLYDWSTANTVCPSGWHLPDSSEWKKLSSAVGSTKTGLQANSFAVTAGGYYDGVTFNSYFVNSYWWTSSAGLGGTAKDIALLVYPGTLATGQVSQAYGLSVRCVLN